MKVVYHPDFPKDIRKFEVEYQQLAIGLGTRFRQEVDEALNAIKAAPQSAGHFL